MRLRPLPPEFVRLATPDRRSLALLVVDRELELPVRELGLIGSDGAWIASPTSAPGARGRVEGAGRAPSAVIALPGCRERLHLRALRHGGWWAGLWGSRMLGPGRALAELSVAARLRAAGAPVARVVLVAAQPAHPGWRVAVGSELVEGAQDGRRWLAGSADPAAVAAVARAAGRSIRRFHDAGGRHRDLHLGNLLVRSGGTGGPEVIVVDLDGARAGAPPGARRRARELMRLQRSLAKGGLREALGRRGRAAFLAGYCAGDRALRRALVASGSARRARAVLHRWRYPASR